MVSAAVAGMGAVVISFGPSGWLRPARPGEGPGLVWESGVPAEPLPFEPPARLPDLSASPIGDLMAAWLALAAALPGPGAAPPGAAPPDAPPQLALPGEATIPPGPPPTVLPTPTVTAPPRAPAIPEPLFPAPILAGGDSQRIEVPDGAAGIFHRPGVTDRHAEGLGWRITGGADAALFLMDPASGTLGFLTPPEAARPGDADADGVYELAFEVRDGWGAAATQRLLVAVTDAVFG